MIIAGGYSPADDPVSTFADGVAFSPATDRWRHLPTMEPGRAQFAAAWTGHQLIVWGGVIPGELKDTPFSDRAAYQPA